MLRLPKEAHKFTKCEIKATTAKFATD